MSDDSRKQNFDRWITIANLVLTALIGIGVALYLNSRDEATQAYLKTRDEELAKYLADRDEKFQERLVQLQADVNRQAALATVALSNVCVYYTTCTSGFQVTNTGPAAANDLTVVAYLQNYWPDEQPENSRLANYFLFSNSPSANQTITQTRVTAIHQEFIGPENNAFKIEIPLLPSGTSISYSILWLPEQRRTETYTSTLRLHYSEINEGTMGSEMAIGDYMDERLRVGTFTIDASCANCSQKPESAMVNVSNSGAWRMRATEFGADPHVADYVFAYDQYLVGGMKPVVLGDSIELGIVNNEKGGRPHAVDIARSN